MVDHLLHKHIYCVHISFSAFDTHGTQGQELGYSMQSFDSVMAVNIY